MDDLITIIVDCQIRNCLSDFMNQPDKMFHLASWNILIFLYWVESKHNSKKSGEVSPSGNYQSIELCILKKLEGLEKRKNFHNTWELLHRNIQLCKREYWLLFNFKILGVFCCQPWSTFGAFDLLCSQDYERYQILPWLALKMLLLVLKILQLAWLVSSTLFSKLISNSKCN